jgi:hypothetical protein
MGVGVAIKVHRLPHNSGRVSLSVTSGARPLGYGPHNDDAPITVQPCGGRPSRQFHRHARLFGDCLEVSGGPNLAISRLPGGAVFGPIFMARLSQCGVHPERASRCAGTWRRQWTRHLRRSGRTTGNGRQGERSVPWDATHASPSRNQRDSSSSRSDDPFEYLLNWNHHLAGCFCRRRGNRPRSIRPHRDGHAPSGVALTISARPVPEHRLRVALSRA